MSTTQPIKSYTDIRKFKNYFLKKEEYRNYLLVSICLNTALRISDVLSLKWEDIINIKNMRVKKHLRLTESKTGKATTIKLNDSIKSAIKLYIKKEEIKFDYIFAGRNGKPISRIDAFYIVKNAGISVGLEHEISPHSLRKTFGYHAVKKGVSPAVIMQIYNHSSYEITKRYLGIAQDDKDKVYMDVAL